MQHLVTIAIDITIYGQKKSNVFNKPLLHDTNYNLKV